MVKTNETFPALTAVALLDHRKKLYENDKKNKDKMSNRKRYINRIEDQLESETTEGVITGNPSTVDAKRYRHDPWRYEKHNIRKDFPSSSDKPLKATDIFEPPEASVAEEKAQAAEASAAEASAEVSAEAPVPEKEENPPCCIIAGGKKTRRRRKRKTRRRRKRKTRRRRKRKTRRRPKKRSKKKKTRRKK